MEHHSVIYEQMPWNRSHAEAIYGNLAGILVADGAWNPFPPLPVHVGFYRVFDDRYLQVVYADKASEENLLLDQIREMDALTTGHDAEWTIDFFSAQTDDEEPYYEVTSRFAVTPGPFPHHKETDSWLTRHALGLHPHEFHMEGYAEFMELTPECLLDAIERLHWLEGALREINRTLTKQSEQFWQELKLQSDAWEAQYSEIPEDTIVPVPEYLEEDEEETGYKKRVAVSEMPEDALASLFPDRFPKPASSEADI